MLKVKNMTSSRGTTIANQFIISNDNMVTFQSYNSLIITIDYDNKVIKVHPDYNYSTTTSKYRNIFLRDYGFDGLSTLKELDKAIANGTYNGYIIKKVA